MSSLKVAIASIAFLTSTQAAIAQLDERILWRFELPSPYAGAHIGVGDDGTVYATDNLDLYSLSPDGDLNWTLAGAGGGRPITFAPDGTIYTAALGAGIVAIHPDGTERWVFMPPSGVSLHTGPNVGPDGNLYAVQEIRAGEGIGAYSVDADGNLHWSDPGDPEIGPADLSNSDVVFGDDRLFAGMDFPRGHGAVTYAYTLDGSQVGYSGGGGWELPATSFPRMMLDGRIAYRYGQVGLMAVTQDGAIDWQLVHPGGASFVIGPAVGPDGVLYAGNWSGIRLWAVDADGTTRWVRDYESGFWIDTLAVAPDNSVLVATGTPGWVRGYDPANGDLLWQVDLPMEQGLAQYAETVRAAFSPDSQTAYVTTRFVGDGVGHSYVYAIRTGGGEAYVLGVDNLVAGADAVFSIQGATPNERQILAYSLVGPGSKYVPRLDVTLDLANPKILASGRADADGVLELSVPMPPGSRGRALWLQAAEAGRTTNVVAEVVE